MDTTSARLEMSESIVNVSKALVAAQADVGTALKNQENSHFKSQYADLNSVLEVAKPALALHGLGLIQCPGQSEGTVTMTTLLMHESGEWILLPPASIPLQAQTAHGYGSAISYLRRYTAQAALGISVGSEDDDGNKATAEAPKGRSRANGPAKPEQSTEVETLIGELLALKRKVKDETLREAAVKAIEKADPAQLRKGIAILTAHIEEKAA